MRAKRRPVRNVEGRPPRADERERGYEGGRSRNDLARELREGGQLSGTAARATSPEGPKAPDRGRCPVGRLRPGGVRGGQHSRFGDGITNSRLNLVNVDQLCVECLP